MRAPAERVLGLLASGEIELLGLMPGASNYTFACRVADGELETLAVYKPQIGETPLWDFPDGTLYAREIAAYRLGEALGWSLVPPTIEREGPHGVGSLQLFIEHDPEQHYLTLMPEHADEFRKVVAFDVVTNNADRKSGACLLEHGTGRLWFIDHGVCFHTEPKLRTVMWDFAGEPLPEHVVEGLRALQSADFGALLGDLLAPDEIVETRARLDALLREGAFPEPPEDRRSYPWPPI